LENCCAVNSSNWAMFFLYSWKPTTAQITATIEIIVIVIARKRRTVIDVDFFLIAPSLVFWVAGNVTFSFILSNPFFYYIEYINYIKIFIFQQAS